MSTDPAGPASAQASRGRFEDRPGHLLAEVDLTVDVTDARGRNTSGRLTGTANRLRLEVTDPAVVLAATGRGASEGLGTRLADVGMRVELHGPSGRVAMIDPERTSRVGSWLGGSPHVIFERSGWTVPVRAVLAGRTTLLTTAAVVLGVGVLAAGLRRR